MIIASFDNDVRHDFGQTITAGYCAQVILSARGHHFQQVLVRQHRRPGEDRLSHSDLVLGKTTDETLGCKLRLGDAF